MTPFLASKKVKEKIVYNNFKDNRETQKIKYKLGQLVPTADFTRVFIKFDSPNWSYNLNTINEVIHDTKHRCRIKYLPEIYDENLLLPTKLSLEQNNQVMKKLNLIQ